MVTDEDILLKKFKNAGALKSGYDKDDVDDFLDEVAETVRQLNKKNSELEKSHGLVPESEMVKDLKAKNSELEEKIKSLESAKPEPSSKGASSDELKQKNNEIDSLNKKVAQLEKELTDAKKANTAEKEIDKVDLTKVKPDPNEVESATNMLSLAQKLHDEYINNAKDEATKIVDDSNAKATKIVNDAEYKAYQLKKQQEDETNRFKVQKTELEQKIEKLKAFEGDYRSRLTRHLKTLLDDMQKNFS